MAIPRPARSTPVPKNDDDNGQSFLEALEEEAAENGPAGPVPATPDDDDVRSPEKHERIRTDHEPKT